MKLEHLNNTLESNGLEGAFEFKIEDSALAFKILSADIYTDKLAAPIRELCCNAFDAHTAVNNRKTPIQITLPSTKNKNFSVRDFGPGMNQEEMEKIYTSYFSSTKKESNAFTGGFGIGSKSPFALIDEFEVRSFQAGEETTYLAYLDENRVPRLRVVGKKRTKEADGLLVTMQVPGAQHTSFNQTAERISGAFGQPFSINGVDQKKGNLHANEKQHALNTNEGSLVVMGNVAYPVSKYLADNVKDLPILAILSRGHIFHVEVGGLNVAASREDLSYDPKTIKSMKKIVETYFHQLIVDIHQEVQTKTATSSKFVYANELGKRLYRISHEKSFIDNVNALNIWDDAVKKVVTGGLPGLLPASVKIAVVDVEQLEYVEYKFAGSFERKQNRDGHRAYKSLIETLQSIAQNKRGSTYSDNDFDQRSNTMLLGMLATSVRPYKKAWQGADSHYCCTSLSRHIEKLKEIDRGGFSNRTLRPMRGDDLGKMIPTVCDLLHAIETKENISLGKDKHCNGMSYILYPSDEISDFEFCKIISEINKEWGLSLYNKFDSPSDVIEQESVAEEFVGKCLVDKKNNFLLKSDDFNGRNDYFDDFGYFSEKISVMDSRLGSRKEMIATLAEVIAKNEKFLYIEEVDPQFSRYVLEGAIDLMPKIQDVSQEDYVFLVDKVTAEKIEKTYSHLSRKVADVVKEKVLPWLMENTLVTSKHAELLSILLRYGINCKQKPLLLETLKRLHDGAQSRRGVQSYLGMIGCPIDNLAIKKIMHDYPLLAYAEGSGDYNFELLLNYVSQVEDSEMKKTKNTVLAINAGPEF